jgi:hypothetical protein
MVANLAVNFDNFFAEEGGSGIRDCVGSTKLSILSLNPQPSPERDCNRANSYKP